MCRSKSAPGAAIELIAVDEHGQPAILGAFGLDDAVAVERAQIVGRIRIDYGGARAAGGSKMNSGNRDACKRGHRFPYNEHRAKPSSPYRVARP